MGDVTRKSRRGSSTLAPEDRSRVVGVACELRLISVDDVAEVFKVATLIHCHFTDPSVRPSASAEDDFVRDPDYSGFVPEIAMVNIVDSQWEQAEVVVRVNRRTGVVWTATKNTYDINESLELQSFPFDRQLFRVGFKSPNAVLDIWRERLDVLDFPPVMRHGKVVGDNDASFLVSCELNTWYMAGVQVELQRGDADPVSLTGTEFNVIIKGERDPRYYLWNYITIMYIVVALNATNMGVGVDSMGDRLAASLTLLLAGVAFKFVLDTTLPKIGYATIADVYVRISFLVLFVGCLENFFVSTRVLCTSAHFDGGSDAVAVAAAVEKCAADAIVGATRVDLVFHVVYVAVWTLINMVAAFFCLKPNLLRPTWEHVINNQIGDTEATTCRTSDVIDGDAEDHRVLIK